MPGKPYPRFIHSILIVTLLLMSCCATQKPEIEKTPVSKEEPEDSEISAPTSSNTPPQSTFNNGQELRLVRIMDGGACNSGDQGARGLFLVYAEPGDIKRIKKEKGPEVFEKFQHDIERLSLQALQESIDVMNLSDNPFALDLDDALHQVVDQLISNFKEFAEPAIESFESNTSLTIDVVPFSPSMGFILENCNSALNEPPESL